MDEEILRSPPVDKVGEDVAMARIRSALFGESQRASLERYALLDKLGEGSYGAVYTAWDPRLDRKVAIKVLHGGANEALEREARALAKLSHPNVVTVHDVGESAGAVFLAMEFVDGTPLSALDVATLGWRKVVATYRQAAAGLAAAHAAGVVHRDFKPANALLGHDGRVRVLDFGLARAGMHGAWDQSTQVQTRAGGTPLYMAPEQHRGDLVDARADQYGFCAALWEALVGTPPFTADTMAALAEAKARPPSAPTTHAVPPAVTRILQRGLSPDPADRFESMAALDAALGRTLQRRTRMLAAAALTCTALAAGVGLGRVERPCAGSNAPPPRWTAHRKETLLAAFEATALPHARTSAETASALLDDWAAAWGASRQSACVAHERGLQSDARLDRRIACLDAQRERFDALLDVFAEADVSAVDKAVGAVGALPSPSACNDDERFGEQQPIPPEHAEAVTRARQGLTRARAELGAGHYERARELAQPHVEACDAEALRHRPTCVEAVLVHAEAAGYAGRHDEAVAGLRRAAVEAQRERLHVPFARAAANLTWELGEVDARFDDALTWAALGHAALTGNSAPEVERELLNNEGAVLFTAARFDESAAVHGRRLDSLPPDSPLRMTSLSNLANIDNRRGNIEEADRAYTEAIEIGMRAYGPSHPRVLAARHTRAGMRARSGRAAQAVQELEEVVAAHLETLGPDHPERAAPLTNLAVAQLQLDDATGSLASAQEARRLIDRTYGPRSAASIDIRLAEADALVALHRHDEAIALCNETLEVTESLYGPTHSNMAFVRRGLAVALLAAARTDEATAQLTKARAGFETDGMRHEVAIVDDLLAQSKASRSD
ncbi:MAG: protein kinase domain-containing protein [Nannocystaceae bacterium]|nr:serine/threonine-protein kinase [bacterium]